eukprot:m51a1_g7042 hypothetical protein (1420) ;mRNA; f:113742-121077
MRSRAAPTRLPPAVLALWALCAVLCLAQDQYTAEFVRSDGSGWPTYQKLVPGDSANNVVTIAAPSLFPDHRYANAYGLSIRNTAGCITQSLQYLANPVQGSGYTTLGTYTQNPMLFLNQATCPNFPNGGQVSLKPVGCGASSVFRVTVNYQYQCKDFMNAPSLASPLDGNITELPRYVDTIDQHFRQDSIVFKWTYTPHDSCIVPAPAAVHNVYIDQWSLPSSPTSTLTTAATTVTFSPTSLQWATGTWYIKVDVSNGYDTPSAPLITSPTTDPYTSTKPSINLEWDVTNWGDSCQGGTNKFFLRWGNVTGSEVVTDMGTSTIAVKPLSPGTWRYSVTATNGVLSTSTPTKSIIYETPCVIQMYPSNQQVILPQNFTWTVGSWGESCGQEKTVFITLDNGQSVPLDYRTKSFTVSGLNSGSHQWTVTASSGTLSTSSTSKFTVCIPADPSSPSLLQPPAGGFAITPVALSWSTLTFGNSCGFGYNRTDVFVSGPTGFQYHASLNSSSGGITLTVPASGVYQWYVNASNGYAQPVSSAAQTFNACVPRLPQNFTLTSPVDTTLGTTASTYKATLAWYVPPDVTDASCSSPVTQQLVVSNATGVVANLSLSLDVRSYDIALPEGDYVWQLTLVDAPYWSTSQSARFHVCRKLKPANLTNVLPAEGDTMMSRYITLQWDIGFPGATCGDGDTGFDVMATRVDRDAQVDISSVVLSKQASLPGSARSYPMRVEQQGRYLWAVTARSGSLSLPGPVSTFLVCFSEAPSPPVPKSPPFGLFSYVPDGSLNTTVSFNAFFSSSIGSWCQNTTQSHYVLLLGSDSNHLAAMGSVAVSQLGNSSGPSFPDVTLGAGTFFWTVDLVNGGGLSSPASQRQYSLYTVCQHALPATLESPANGTQSVSTAGLQLRWRKIGDEQWGQCIAGKVHQITVKVEIQLAGANSTKKLSFVVSALDNVLALPIENVTANATYRWSVFMFNGAEDRSSPEWTFTTQEADCRSMGCGNGHCDTAQMLCVCTDGSLSSGPCVSHAKDGTNAAAIAAPVAIGGTLLIAGLIVAALLMAKKRNARRKRIYLESPEYKMRFAPCKPPAKPPAGNAESFEQMIAMDCERGFPYALGLARTCQVTESDNLAKYVVYVYERHGASRQLLEALIRDEVETCEQQNVLFRGNSIATKAFKFYSKMVSLPYVYRTFGALLKEILQKEEDRRADDKDEERALREGKLISMRLYNEAGYEVDPEKLDVADDSAALSLNVLQLCLTTQQFITQIFLSVPDMPPEIAHVCWTVRDAVTGKFPHTRDDKKVLWSAVGAFLFLRLLNIAISLPEFYGLLKKPPNETLRRCLVLVTKVLQNLSTATLFGDKEAYMTNFNELIHNNMVKLDAFYESVTRTPEDVRGAKPVVIPDDIYDNCLRSLMAHTEAAAGGSASA